MSAYGDGGIRFDRDPRTTEPELLVVPIAPAPLTEAEYAASLPGRVDRIAADINEGVADVLPDGMRFAYEPIDNLGHPLAPDGTPIPETPEAIRRREARVNGDPAQLLDKRSAMFMVPPGLLDDYADMGDLIGKALRGEIELKPPEPPRRHRCLACWLISLLPGHDRCTHGRLDCDDCWEEAR